MRVPQVLRKLKNENGKGIVISGGVVDDRGWVVDGKICPLTWIEGVGEAEEVPVGLCEVEEVGEILTLEEGWRETGPRGVGVVGTTDAVGTGEDRSRLVGLGVRFGEGCPPWAEGVGEELTCGELVEP